jgi:Domain of unknown function (DUF4440)
MMLETPVSRAMLGGAAFALCAALAAARGGRAFHGAVRGVAEAGPVGGAPMAARPAPTLGDSLIALEQDSWRAWQKRDGRFFEGFLSDDHVEIGAGGIQGKTAVVAGVASPACTVRTYATDHFELTRLSATAALLTYHASQETTCNGQAVPSPVWVGSLYVLREDRWVNAAYQQTPAHP